MTQLFGGNGSKPKKRRKQKKQIKHHTPAKLKSTSIPVQSRLGESDECHNRSSETFRAQCSRGCCLDAGRAMLAIRAGPYPCSGSSPLHIRMHDDHIPPVATRKVHSPCQSRRGHPRLPCSAGEPGLAHRPSLDTEQECLPMPPSDMQ